MLEAITALFCGAMLPALPYLLLQVLQAESEESVVWRMVAWAVLALFAWCFSLYLAFLAPLFALVGIIVGALLVWRDNRKPRIVFQETEEE